MATETETPAEFQSPSSGRGYSYIMADPVYKKEGEFQSPSSGRGYSYSDLTADAVVGAVKFQSPSSGRGYSYLMGKKYSQEEMISFNPLLRGVGILTCEGISFPPIGIKFQSPSSGRGYSYSCRGNSASWCVNYVSIPFFGAWVFLLFSYCEAQPVWQTFQSPSSGRGYSYPGR